MKKLLLLSVAALGLLAPKANAYTAQEIAASGKVWRSLQTSDVYYSNGRTEWQYTANIPYLLEGDVNCSVNDKGQLVIDLGMDETFFNGEVTELPLILDINGTTAKAANGSFDLYVETGYGNGAVYTTDLKFVRITNVDNYFYGIIPLRSNLMPKAGDFTGTISKDADGNFKIDFGPFELVKIHQTRGYIHVFDVDGNYIGSGTVNYFVLDQDQECAGALFQTYVPNATITDTEYDLDNNFNKTNANPREYSANVKVNGTNIEIDNWSNIGRPAVSYLDKEYILHSNHEKFTGTFNPDDMTFDIRPSEVMIGRMAWLDNSGTLGLWARNMTGAEYYDIRNDVYSSITGQVSEADTYTHVGTNTWLNRLDNKTMLNDYTINFDDYFFVDVEEDSYYMSSYVEGTTLKVNDNIEYTHDVEIGVNLYGYGAVTTTAFKQLFINFDIKNIKNNNLVESYDLFIVPGFINNANYSSEEYMDPEKGHTLGTLIDVDEYLSDFNPFPEDNVKSLQSVVDSQGTTNFNIVLPESAIENTNDKGEYSLYLRANYKPETGLAPSFHALKSLETAYTVGVENIVADREESQAVYYNLNGIEVNADNLTPGVYVRRQGNTATKIIVK